MTGGTDSPITPDDDRLQRFDAAAQARREAEAKDIERQRQFVVDSIERERVTAEQRREERRRQEEHAAKRPERWGRLPLLVKALYVVAAERPHTPAQAALRMAALLTGPDHPFQTPPITFEA